MEHWTLKAIIVCRCVLSRTGKETNVSSRLSVYVCSSVAGSNGELMNRCMQLSSIKRLNVLAAPCQESRRDIEYWHITYMYVFWYWEESAFGRKAWESPIPFISKHYTIVQAHEFDKALW
jgi:hypothetical protein